MQKSGLSYTDRSNQTLAGLDIGTCPTEDHDPMLFIGGTRRLENLARREWSRNNK